MADSLADLETRLAALEVLVAFQFASQHMQTNDPASAMQRLRNLLLDRMDAAAAGGDEQRQEAVMAALDQLAQRIAELQSGLPRRLVD